MHFPWTCFRNWFPIPDAALRHLHIRCAFCDVLAGFYRPASRAARTVTERRDALFPPTYDRVVLSLAANITTMRLRVDQGHGSLNLVEYFSNNIPRYAIISHTWGPDGEEVTFKDFVEGTGKDKADYNKIEFYRKQTVSDGLEHFWVDTCCINKESSAKLSEAINSMYRWYHAAERCYIYLSDVHDVTALQHDENEAQKDALTLSIARERAINNFKKSRWFTRGWTLQELLAPKVAIFYNSAWDLIATRDDLADVITSATGIDVSFLRG